MKKTGLILVAVAGLCLLCYGIGRWEGRQEVFNMWLQVNDPNYISQSDPDYDPNEIDRWKQAAQGWQTAAEHYGGICKWLLENEPIYGTIVMDANTVLIDCLIVSGSKDASIVINGEGALIANSIFRTLAMDWVLSTTAIDPNNIREMENWQTIIDPGSAVVRDNIAVIN